MPLALTTKSFSIPKDLPKNLTLLLPQPWSAGLFGPSISDPGPCRLNLFARRGRPRHLRSCTFQLLLHDLLSLPRTRRRARAARALLGGEASCDAPGEARSLLVRVLRVALKHGDRHGDWCVGYGGRGGVCLRVDVGRDPALPVMVGW